MSPIKAVSFGARTAAPPPAAQRSLRTDAGRRFHRAGRMAAATLSAAALVLAGASAAAARTGYVSNHSQSSITPINLATNTAGMPIADTIGTSSIAITPNGKLAYAPSSSKESVLTPFNLETGFAETPISLKVGEKTKVEPEKLAITPNGRYVYVADEETNGHEGSVSVVEVATGTVVKVIPAGFEPESVAITPNGEFAWVGDKANEKQGTVTVIDHASNPASAEVVQTFDVGSTGAEGKCKEEAFVPTNCVEPESIAITPNGEAAYVADGAGGTVTEFDHASNPAEAKIVKTITETTQAGEDTKQPDEIAIAPNGQTAYVSNGEAGTVTPIDLVTEAVGTPIVVGKLESEPHGLAITPNGKTLYVAVESEKNVTAIDLETNTVETHIEIGAESEPTGVAIVPDQGPTAAFSATPDVAGSASTFNAEGSAAPEGGTITSYQWSFGDGTTETTTTPTASHVYAAEGAYEVTVTEADGEGCSEALVFTGQTAYCNADPAATVHHTITVPAAAVAKEPVITSITPDAGPAEGGTVVTIHGENLEDATSIRFGFKYAGTAVRDTATEIEVAAPSGSAGKVATVCVITPAGEGCDELAFRYEGPAPVITSITPDEGPTAGGTAVTIHGEHLETVTTTEVSFGGSAAGIPSMESATEVEVHTPAHAAGTVEVCVTTKYGTGCKAAAFTYRVPNAASINVNSEPVSEVQSLTTTCAVLNLGVWTPGSESNEEAHCELTATSTAASSTLTAEDAQAASKGTHAGYMENSGSYLTDPLQAQATDGHSHGTSAGFLSLGESPVDLLSFSEAISPDPVTFTVKQHIGAEEGLRKGTYAETVTLTLANTEP